MKRTIPLFVCAAFAALLVAECAFAESVVVYGLQSQPAARDTREYTNTALDSSMWRENNVQSETRLRARASTNDAWQTWLQFDLSSVWATHDVADLQSATLSMMITNMGTSTRKRVYVSGMLDGLMYEDDEGNPIGSYEDWSELTLTWNNAPANDLTSATGSPIWSEVYGMSFISDATYLGGPTEGWAVTGIDDGISIAVELMTGFIATDTDGKVTFILTGHDTTYAYGVGDEFGNGPYLTLTFIPEPATLAILGLGGLLLRRRIA